MAMGDPPNCIHCGQLMLFGYCYCKPAQTKRFQEWKKAIENSQKRKRKFKKVRKRLRSFVKAYHKDPHDSDFLDALEVIQECLEIMEK